MSSRLTQASDPDRILGVYGQGKRGPLVFCVGAMHGNETCGVDALRQCFSRLDELRPPFAGKLVGVIGNLAAYNQNERYIDIDLNRSWAAEHADSILSGDPDGMKTGEDYEMKALLELLEAGMAEREGSLVFIDMHGTSSESPPFTIISGTAHETIAFARALKAPVIGGFDHILRGAALQYVARRGHVSVAYEAGRYDSPAAVEKLIAALWIGLAEVGCIDPADIPEFDDCRRLLETDTRHLPAYTELIYRHEIRPADDFVMQPGFRSFDYVQAGQPLARDARGTVRAPADGYLLMPLYQRKGNDGFFLVKPL